MDNYFGLNVKNIREYWGLSQEEFGYIIGASRGMIMQYENRGSSPKSDTAWKIEETIEIPLEVLNKKILNRTEFPEKPGYVIKMIEEYKKTKEENEQRSKRLIATFKNLYDKSSTSKENDLQNQRNWKGVPIYDLPVAAGISVMIRDEKTTEPAYYLPIPGFKDCKFGARVTGDSMYPEIRSGDYIVLKEVTDFIYGDIYLVVTKDGQETVKRVYPNEDDPNKINLVPSNKEIPVTPILKDNIIKILKVKGVIKGY